MVREKSRGSMTENRKPKEIGIERFFKSSAASYSTGSSTSEETNANTLKRDTNEVSQSKETFEEETNDSSNKPHQSTHSFLFP